MSTAAQRARHRDQREITRRDILAAADRFLRERPYRELSIEVVMEGTGLTRTAFYRHFDDITDLVLRLFAEVGRELFEVAQKWRETAGMEPPAPARAALAAIVEFFVRNGPLVRAIADAAATDERIEAAYRGSTNAFVQIAATTLERLAGEGQVNLPDPQSVARALTMMTESYLLDEFGREPYGDREVALRTLETIWLRVGMPELGA